MSWSMFSYGNHWAHAHDAQQEFFMRLGAMYLLANPRYAEIAWFRSWATDWIESAGNQGNGCSDLLAGDYLTGPERAEQFCGFLRDYQAWVTAVEGVIRWEMQMPPDKAVAFAQLVHAVVTGDESHPAVNRSQPS
jgi:hypothetical protein